jgi:hypothetical protein
VQVVIDGFFPAARFRLRHIPGPAPWWLVGNTLEIAAHDYFLFKAWEVWGGKYGKVFKWFWGPQPVVTIRGEQGGGIAARRHVCSQQDWHCPLGQEPTARDPP